MNDIVVKPKSTSKVIRRILIGAGIAVGLMIAGVLLAAVEAHDELLED